VPAFLPGHKGCPDTKDRSKKEPRMIVVLGAKVKQKAEEPARRLRAKTYVKQ